MTALLLLALAQCQPLAELPAAGSCSLSDAGVSSCAPGLADTDDLDVICHQTTTKRRCRFDSAWRSRMLAAYSMTKPPAEWDHRISLELGGSNDSRNIQPQYEPDARMKDAVENHLHSAVCSGQLSLEAARALLLDGWRSVYAGMKR